MIGRRIARRPRPVWIGSTLALGILALGGLGIKTGLDEENVVTSTPESLAGQQVLAEHYPAGQGGRPVQVITNAPAADDVTAAIQQVEGVAEVVPGERSTDGQLVSVDVVLADPSDGPAAEATVDRIRAAAHAIPQAGALVGGSTAEQLDIDRAQEHDRQAVIPLVLAVVLAGLLLLLRAVIASLLLIATVVLSYFAALGAS